MFRRLLPLLLAAPLTAQTTAPAHPNFTGTWILDATRSTVDGPIPAATSGTSVIVQVGDSMTIDQKSASEQGEMAMQKVWKVDGKVWANTMTYMGTDMALSSVLRWNGAVLEVHTDSDFSGTPVEQNESWSLAADGKTLTLKTTTNVNGSYYASMTLVFARK